jgi:hypothetical protein
MRRTRMTHSFVADRNLRNEPSVVSNVDEVAILVELDPSVGR